MLLGGQAYTAILTQRTHFVLGRHWPILRGHLEEVPMLSGNAVRLSFLEAGRIAIIIANYLTLQMSRGIIASVGFSV